MEQFLRKFLTIPRRIYDGFLRFKESFGNGNWGTKLRLIILITLLLFILIPVIAFIFCLFIALFIFSFIVRLIMPRRKGPTDLYY